MLMFGRPVVISLTLMPWMPSDVAACVAVVGLRRERQRAGVAEAELVDEARADDLRVVEGQAVRRQARVLDAGDVGAEVEAGRRLLGRRQTAGRLALRRVELELAVGEADEERVVVRQPVIDAAGDLVLGHFPVRGVQVVVEVARLVRLGVDAGDVAPDRVDAVLRNDVARERIAKEPTGSGGVRPRRQRIVDDDERAGRRVAEVAEVAVALRRGRHGVDERQAARLLPAGVVGEEEGAVRPLVARQVQRPADGAAELVLAEGRLRHFGAVGAGPLREVVVGVEDVVADEVEDRAAELVRARLGRHRDDAGAAAELGREDAVQHLELAHRLDRRRDDDGVEGELVVVDAVDEPAVGVGLLAEGVEVGGAARVEGAGAGEVLALLARRHAGDEVDERREVALVQRQLADRLLLDDRADFGRLGLDQRRRRDDRRHFGELADLEAGVDAGAIVDLDGDALAHVLLEAGQLDFDFIRAGVEERGDVGAVGVGDDRGDGLFADFLDGDRGARHDLALRVGHRADDGSRRDLGGDRRRRTDGCNEPRKQPNRSHVHS